MKTYPYWLDTLGAGASSNPQPPISTPPFLIRKDRYDVAIVGAGYTGLSAARHLARVGATVTVLERDVIGAGASSRNAGQVLTGLKVDAGALVDRWGEHRARQLFELSMESMARLEAVITAESIDCEYVRSGHLMAAWKPAHFQAFGVEQALLARVFNHHVHLVPASAQRNEIGTDRYFGLMVDEKSAALNPVQYVRGLAAAAARAGADIVEHAEVTRIGGGPDRWQIATTRGPVAARDLLVATNGYTGAVTPDLQRRFIPIGSYVIATEPLSAGIADAILPRRRVAFDSKNFLFYFRLTADRRLLFGGRAEFGRPTPQATGRAAATLRDGMLRIFPELAGAAIDYAWSGEVAFTRDQMPRAGRICGYYYAGGYCGHGIAMATYLGEEIARRIGGEPIEHPLFDDRFPAIPLYSGTPWFLPAVGAYYQVKDWLQ